MAFLLLIFSCLVFATDSPFQQMINGQRLQATKESHVVIDGIEYKKIEVESDSYYINLKGRKSGVPEVLCERPSGFESERLLETGIQVKKRKVAYLSLLRESCSSRNGQMVKSVELKPELGVFLKEEKGDTIKNKKLGVNPLDPKMLNFSGEFE